MDISEAETEVAGISSKGGIQKKGELIDRHMHVDD